MRPPRADGGDGGEQCVWSTAGCDALACCLSARLPSSPPPFCTPAGLCLSPEGRGAKESHVKIPTELLAAFPPPAGDDARFLAEIAKDHSLDKQ